MQPVRWGVLGVSKFAMTKVIPAMKSCAHARIEGIASRDAVKAKDAATRMGIAKSYGSYEEMLADPEIDVVYNPLPNHMHVSWSVQAADAGKHVLCEKPIGMNTGEVRELIAARDRNSVQVAEAFMVRTHPQWLRAVELAQSGAIGELRAVQTAFGYYNVDGNNIRNKADIGGGALMDIGCYGVFVSRWLFGAEPRRVVALAERDREFGTDRLTSAILDFAGGQASFVCGTQQTPFQRVQIIGSKARIEIQVPFNALPGERMKIWIDDGSDLRGAAARLEEAEACDQYTIQGDVFSAAVRGEGQVAVPLENAFGNMAVIEALFASAASGRWETPARL
jgi:predicted dehydrogenase